MTLQRLKTWLVRAQLISILLLSALCIAQGLGTTPPPTLIGATIATALFTSFVISRLLRAGG